MGLHTGVNGHQKRVCTESWLWEKIPCHTGESNLPQQCASAASAVCQCNSLPTELHPHPHLSSSSNNHDHFKTCKGTTKTTFSFYRFKIASMKTCLQSRNNNKSKVNNKIFLKQNSAYPWTCFFGRFFFQHAIFNSIIVKTLQWRKMRQISLSLSRSLSMTFDGGDTQSFFLEAFYSLIWKHNYVLNSFVTTHWAVRKGHCGHYTLSPENVTR